MNKPFKYSKSITNLNKPFHNANFTRPNDMLRSDISRLQTTAKHKRHVKRLWLSLATAGVLVGGFSWLKYNTIKNSMADMYVAYKQTDSKRVDKVTKAHKPISILLLGTDTGALGRTEKGRTDTIIVATLNPKTDSMVMTSLPRDLAVSVSGYENQGMQKLNSAYSFGGIKSTIKTVESEVGVPIDYYALINMGGLEKVIDVVGGIEVNPPLTFKYGHANVTKHKTVHLNGKQALDYARMRHADTKGDYGRQTRQRQVIMALFNKANSAKSVINDKLFSSLQGQLQTNVPFDQILKLYTGYHTATHHLKSNHLQGTGQMIEEQAFEVADRKELTKIHNYLSKNLGDSLSSYNLDKLLTTDNINGDADNTNNQSSNSNNQSGNNNYQSDNSNTQSDTSTAQPANESYDPVVPNLDSSVQ